MIGARVFEITKRDITPNTFLALARIQLARDCGRGADCKPLYMKGSRGALLKFRLSSHGYTLVAKGMKQADRQHLLHESKVYNHLRSIQGSCIPVSLGIVDLELPYYYDTGIYISMLFLSWAGRSICQYLTPNNEACILDQVTHGLKALHEQRVLHNDVEPRSCLWDEQCSRLMLVGFERAVISIRLPLGALSPNRKRNRQYMKLEIGDDGFDCEMRNARNWISRSIR